MVAVHKEVQGGILSKLPDGVQLQLMVEAQMRSVTNTLRRVILNTQTDSERQSWHHRDYNHDNPGSLLKVVTAADKLGGKMV